MVTLLSVWGHKTPDELLTDIRAADPESDMSEDDLKSVTQFLYENKLTLDPPADDTESFARQEAAKRIPLHEMLVHRYLFFRIPLFNPQGFLKRFEAPAQIFFKRSTWMVIAVMGVIGLVFAARQWDEFVTTFLYFFTLEGFVFYALTLAIIKVLHELGHAFAARHFGARVPVIGVAFLVMFPILYTDTTDAWRLMSRRARLFIDAGGMMVELGIACLTIFAWSFLPDGPLRSVAFFAATTSWVMSLFVNLNPFMRFDGYYLMGDFFRVQNLQKRGFEWGRWVMRETLFALGKPQPFPLSPRAKIGFTTYAYCTWIYRFFLFIGIAILVHHLFPKAIGIVLFTIEILFFIVMPIAREMKVWGDHHMRILSTTRGRTTLAISALLLAAFFIPWQSTIRAPALLQPAQSTEIFPPAAAKIDTIWVKSGQTVKAGETLISLSAPHLIHEARQARQRLALIDAQMNRAAANLNERRFAATLIEARAKEIGTLSGLAALENQLVLRAPHDGIVTDLPETLHTGRFVAMSEPLLRLIGPEPAQLIIFPPDYKVARLQDGADLRFISDDPMRDRIKGSITAISPTSTGTVEHPIVTSIAGGPIGVTENTQGQLVPDTQVFRVDASVSNTDARLRAQRGLVHIKATPESPATSLWRSVMAVLIRETDF